MNVGVVFDITKLCPHSLFEDMEGNPEGEGGVLYNYILVVDMYPRINYKQGYLNVLYGY